MSQDFEPLNKKRCYACIQWDGIRTISVDQDGKKVLRVDKHVDGYCNQRHLKIRGDKTCKLFFKVQ